jgi:biopolymer transport protein ExbD
MKPQDHSFMNQQRMHTEPEINITPMLDVVFIMLIFFIVTTSFVKETGLTVSRPSTGITADGQAVLIKLDAQQVMLNHQVVSIEGLEARLNQLQSTQPDVQVQLLSDADTPVARLVAVVDQLKAAEVKQIAVRQY